MLLGVVFNDFFWAINVLFNVLQKKSSDIKFLSHKLAICKTSKIAESTEKVSNLTSLKVTVTTKYHEFLNVIVYDMAVNTSRL